MNTIHLYLIVVFTAFSSPVDNAEIKSYYFTDLCLMKNGSAIIELASSLSLQRSSVVIQGNRGDYDESEKSWSPFNNLCTVVLVPPTNFTNIVVAVRLVELRSRIHCFDNLTISDLNGSRHTYCKNQYDREERNTSTFMGRTTFELRTGPRSDGPHVYATYGRFTLTVTSYSRVPCLHSQFECSNGRCIANVLRCNGQNNCGDRSDELRCNSTVLPRCPPFNFQCLNGMCIDMRFLCDDDDWFKCGDGSDEAFCHSTNETEEPSCLSEYFQCSNLYCVPKSDLCDGYNDCGDWTDEQTCPTQLPCATGGFRCANGRCIRGNLKCSRTGYSYCGDSSDLVGCPITTTTPMVCNSWEFLCDNGRCIRNSLVCDGADTCGDRSDERNCPTTKKPCYFWEFSCDNGECVPQNAVCNGLKDCGDWSDERGCSSPIVATTCGFWQFTCDNGKCVPKSDRCDGYNDCGDMSDERNCMTTPKPCGLLQFTCDNGRCVLLSDICDGYDDCGDMSDERNCITTRRPICDVFTFTCRNGNCVNSRYVCDGDNDCGDWSDEANCIRPTSPTSKRLSGGAIVGIVLACVFVILSPIIRLRYIKSKNSRTAANVRTTPSPYTVTQHFPNAIPSSPSPPSSIALSAVHISDNQDIHDKPPDYSTLFP